ncbi:hypothetical protein HPB49_011006 [Dermacentor silvarum]|uniref:Uncharacterized protein n=1 Tax=Dermacentor silvarum TaxID=543639 RepID=A0ACB8DZL4_DERSI|nr:hypothetical protein HPB49_011006 [Dermacentor silvarum]
MLIQWSLYKKQIDICYGYGRTGHRADVCPNPEDELPGCRCKNPQHHQNCQAVCQLCSRDHLTGDKKCEARYKILYLVTRHCGGGKKNMPKRKTTTTTTKKPEGAATIITIRR